jgi:hypothetical protein
VGLDLGRGEELAREAETVNRAHLGQIVSHRVV